MGDFDQDTRVTADAGRQRATLSEDWRIWGPNGGYLAAIALRAVGHHARIPRPASFHGHFLAVGRFDAVDLEVEPVRIGRRSESLRVRMLQDGKPLLEALVRTAAEVPGLEHDVAMMPDVPPPDGLRNVEELRREFAPWAACRTDRSPSRERTARRSPASCPPRSGCSWRRRTFDSRRASAP
jgi:acyl-CoA thioesterase